MQIALGTISGAANLLGVDYTYGTTANHGNVLTQTITVPTVGASTGFTAVQTYNYDSVNRLKDATENITPHGGSQTQSWKQVFRFDRYGNRNFVTGSGQTTTLGSCPTAVCNPSIDPSSNRLTSSTYGYNFDSAGNTTRDASDRKFTYDAENKQTKVESLTTGTNTVTGTVGEYSYDGDGKRVKKYAPSTGETTVFVYDAAGKLIEEYSTIVETTNAKVAYLTNDHLGSPRINTDANGNVTSRHDYHPFGEKIATSQRLNGVGYADDSVRKQFTGYERDGESHLDFAQARMFGKMQGRFTPPDPYKIVAEVGAESDPEKAKATLLRYLMQPQQWNQYIYALDNPLKYVDPTGEIIQLTGTAEEQKGALARLIVMLGEERFAMVKVLVVNGNIQLTVDSSNVQKFAAIGDNQDNKDFSIGMAGVLASDRIVEFKIAEKFEYKDQNGKVQVGYTGKGCVISACGNGGITLRPEENASGNGNWQIFVNPSAGEIATAAAAGVWAVSGGKGSLESTNDMVDAHEFGHVWETWQPTRMYGTGRGQQLPMPDSVVFENAVRARYPSPLRRTKH